MSGADERRLYAFVISLLMKWRTSLSSAQHKSISLVILNSYKLDIIMALVNKDS